MTLRYVPQANLTNLDPIAGSTAMTRNYASQVFDTLFASDENLVPRPQMAEGYVQDDDGKRWTIRLREGLVFHDGEKVLARDCVASLKRLLVRDSLGQTLTTRLADIEALDDRTLRIRLHKPFWDIIQVLGKSGSIQPLIVPERLARTDPYKQMPEIVGSGPFRFVQDEYISGAIAVFAKSDRYRPRDEPPSFMAGGKRALLDRVEWRVIPDAATAANALMTGEVDWLETPLPDLLPALRANANVVVEHNDPYGQYAMLRLNHLQGPTGNIGVRQAILAAIDQRDVMLAVMGDDTSGYQAPVSCFLPRSRYASPAGADRLGGQKTPAQIKAMLDQAGYGGEALVLLHPTDQTFYNAMMEVVSASLKTAGFNVDDVAMDWGTVVQRRNNKRPLDKGGWSAFPTQILGDEMLSPLTAYPIRGNADKAWFGWPTDPKVESLRDAWIDSGDEPTRVRLAADMQLQALTMVPFVPLGNFFPALARRRNVTGLLPGTVPVFWNVRKG